MNITSNEIMIFSKEYNGKIYYRAGLSTKKQDGTYENGYIDVKLPKGVNLQDKTKIKITKGFLSFYKKENKDIFYIVIQEYATQSKIKEEKRSDPYEEFGNNITVEQLDNIELPF